MKKLFTKLFSAVLLMCLTLIGFTVKAQTSSLADNSSDQAIAVTAKSSVVFKPVYAKPEIKAATTTKTAAKADEDTTWKPQRRVWGYTFGDFYYDAHSDGDIVGATGVPEGGAGALSKRGGETNYSGVPTYRNAFQFRRIYLGYDYDITKKFKAELLLASEPGANTGAATGTSIQNGDNLVDGKMGFFIKNINIRMRDLWTGTDFVIGEMSTPGFALNEGGTNGPTSLSEATWGYRSIEKTVTDFHKNNSYDVGAALQGTFDPATKNFGYVLMIGNNSQASLLSAANANTGFYKIVYGDIWAKFLNQKLYVDIYTDYAKTAPATSVIPGQDHSMWKIFAAYNTKPITIGVEAYTQKIASGVTDIGSTPTSPKTVADATVTGLSVWVKGAVAKNLNYFARFDTYNPDTDYINTDTYSVNTNYGSYNPTVKEQFYTAGLDYNPTKNVHFMPNFWLINYTDQRASSAAGYVNPDHTLVFRFTFYYTFGK